MMDTHFEHPTNIFALRPCRNPEAPDLLAIGGEHSVQVIQVHDTTCTLLATFRIGSRITALAWSSRTVSPAYSDAWHIDLTCAAADFGLYHLSKNASSGDEIVFPFGGGLSGHHAKVNDMVFAGGWDEESAHDKTLMVWDLYPTKNPTRSPSVMSESDLPIEGITPPPSPREQPNALAFPFPHPLTTIRAHPGTSKEFLVADARGSVFITDWRTLPDEGDDNLRHSSLVELVEPTALARAAIGTMQTWSASVDWKPDAIDIIGGVFGNKFALWDVGQLRGGLPHKTGPTFPDGGHVFRWSPTHTEYFGISASSPTKGAIVQIHNMHFVNASPANFTFAPKPHFIRDFDFLSLEGIPRVAAAIGRKVMISQIGVE
ncbi:hypothetical protein D9619_005706 [Psilocybe cf. subviscida]|uniref:Uncharacterized protein n=1 Tax=Psilocybe cf. subviscida TaxID=2480587 RepID=A0A8H5FC63_9AGAR|nr:hypothetical protein D9619_005706 [Psilocybe cf. subviscida]